MGRTSDAKERLLECASELIHERGYNAVGVGEICSEAGVHKGSFYHFFPSKQQLVLDIVDRHWQTARGCLESQLLGSGPPLERLRRYLDGMLEHHRAAQAGGGKQCGCPLANLAIEMSTQDPVLRERLRQAFDAQVGYFENLLREALKLGQLGPGVEPRRGAEGILALIEGAILLSKVRTDLGPLIALPDQVSALIGARLDLSEADDVKADLNAELDAEQAGG